MQCIGRQCLGSGAESRHRGQVGHRPAEDPCAPRALGQPSLTSTKKAMVAGRSFSPGLLRTENSKSRIRTVSGQAKCSMALEDTEGLKEKEPLPSREGGGGQAHDR